MSNLQASRLGRVVRGGSSRCCHSTASTTCRTSTPTIGVTRRLSLAAQWALHLRRRRSKRSHTRERSSPRAGRDAVWRHQTQLTCRASCGSVSRRCSPARTVNAAQPLGCRPRRYALCRDVDCPAVTPLVLRIVRHVRVTEDAQLMLLEPLQRRRRGDYVTRQADVRVDGSVLLDQSERLREVLVELLEWCLWVQPDRPRQL